MIKMRVLLFLIFMSFATPVYSVVEKVDLDEMIQIGLTHNNDIKMKKLELQALEKDIKIANRLQNPQV